VNSRLRGLRRVRSLGLVALPLTAVLAVTAVAGPASAGATPTPIPGTAVPQVPGYPPVAAPHVAPGPAMHKHAGVVAVNKALRVRDVQQREERSRSLPASATGPATRSASLAARATAAVPVAAAAVTPVTNKTGLRALVIATDPTDFGVPTWQTTLDNVGAAYDVLYARTTPLTSDLLLRPDGAGKYNAILLTSSSLLYQDANGAFLSALNGDQWNLLWAYERDFAVRQAALYNSNGTFPEDYCLRGVSEGGVGSTPLNATLTAAAGGPFSYLKSGATIPIVQSYVYRDSLAAGCNATSLLTAGSSVLAALSPSTDGRERISLTFTSNQYLLQSNLLVYGLFRWASRGLFLGEQRHFLNVDVDDWFNSADELQTNGVLNSNPGFSMSGHDAYNTSTQQGALRSRYPLASTFTVGLAFNGGDADLAAGTACSPNGGIATLTATSRCLRNTFRWINHSLTHPKMNFTDYATNVTEIGQNLSVAATLGLPVDRTVLKTPEYSGLGVYNPNPTNDIDPPTDFGLGASNVAMLQAANALGVKYLHGNMSFASHRPACFNCGLTHPLMPSLNIVPDWPTNIAYFSTTAAEETYFYNLYYGPGGKFPFWPTNLTYPQIISVETDQALGRLSSGSLYTNTFHIANLRDYSAGKTLMTDWADALIGKYSSYYSVPLLSPGWPAIAQYAVNRSAHFAAKAAGVDAVYDRAARTVTVTSPVAGSVTVNGARTAGFTTYGNEVSARLTLSAGTPVVFTPTLLP
jgi:hypothetical protein